MNQTLFYSTAKYKTKIDFHNRKNVKKEFQVSNMRKFKPNGNHENINREN